MLPLVHFKVIEQLGVDEKVAAADAADVALGGGGFLLPGRDGDVAEGIGSGVGSDEEEMAKGGSGKAKANSGVVGMDRFWGLVVEVPEDGHRRPAEARVD